MKRKIFSKLLMVALVIAAVGSFVSCKDYDDDINNLQKQIDNAALKSSVEALQSTLDSKITAAQNAAAAAQTAADKAAATANAAVTKAQLDDAISAAKTAAQTAAETYADKVAAAAKTDAAKDAYDQAKAYVDAEVAKVTAAIPSEAAIKAIADASAAALDEALATELKTWVNQQIDAIDVEGQVEAAVAKAIEKIDTATDNVNAIWAAVTSIEFVYGVDQDRNFDLNFQYGTQLANVFGNKKEVNAYAAADEPKTYVAGDSIKADNIYIVRVSPVTADLSTASLKLMNSKGEDLSDYVDIVAEKYDELLVATRSGENGLWKITATLKDNFKIEDLQKATHAIIDKDGVQQSAAVYALAANNSEKAAADRFAITAYDLLPNTGKYVPASALTFKVNGLAVSNYYNRWNGNYIEAEEGTIERDSTFFELKWKASADDNKTPAVAMNTAKPNYEKDGNDKRKTKERLAVKVGEPIVINFDPDQYKQVDRYYALLDIHNAIESNPSESNIWLKYDIDGLGVMKKSSEKLTITINDKTADGDIIGIRVYAVNYDGTLIDPDGKAFYVEVGEVETVEPQVATAQYVAYQSDGLAANLTTAAIAAETGETSFNWGVVTAAQAGIDPSKFAKLDLTGAQAANTTTLTITDGKIDKAIDGAYALLKTYDPEDADNNELAENWQEINYIAFGVRYAGYQVDGSTVATALDLKGLDTDHHGKLINELKLNVKKVLPSIALEEDKFSWKEGAAVSGNNITFYLLPVPAAVKSEAAVDWTKSATWGVVDLEKLANMGNVSGTAGYRFVFANARPNDATGLIYEKIVNPATTATKSTKVVVDADPAATAAYVNTTPGTYVLALEGPETQADASKRKIGKTSALTVQYKYAGISRTYDSTAKAYSKTLTAIDADAKKAADDAWVAVDSKTAKFSYPLAETTLSTREYSYISAWTQGATVGTNIFFTPTATKTTSYVIEYKAVGQTATPNNFFTWGKSDLALPTVPAGFTAQDNTGGANDRRWADNNVVTGAEFNIGAGVVVAKASFPVSTIGLDLNTIILAKNSKFNTIGAANSNSTLNAAWFVKAAYDEAEQAEQVMKSTFKVRFVSKNNQNEDYYFTYYNENDGKVYFAGTSSAVPSGDVESQLIFKATDAFDFEWTHAVDVTLKH